MSFGEPSCDDCSSRINICTLSKVNLNGQISVNTLELVEFCAANAKFMISGHMPFVSETRFQFDILADANCSGQTHLPQQDAFWIVELCTKL
jgi:hypothetical protein